MSCELHEIGSVVQLRTARQVNVRGGVVNIPVDSIGEVQAVDRNAHMLSVWFRALDITVAIPADAVSSAGASAAAA